MLDNIRKNRIKSSIIIAAATFIAAMILWPLLDLFWSGVISHSEFIYNIKDYIIEPIIFAVIFGLITFFIWKPETKLEKKSKKK
ncbi:hypothetical protein IKG31_04450 [Candidatus Saccharibacteria bacterium]|nr:hypothetical protein [Candidatus Saccharibacteria bacterium]